MLLAAEDEASYIVGLPRGAHEFIHALHQELKGLLSIPIRQIANGAEPAGVSKFFSRFIEGFDYAIGEENQSVTRPELKRSSFVVAVRPNPERQAANLQRFKRAIRAAENRR